jgi:hypothetical protein
LRIELRTDAPVMYICVPAPNQSDVELHVYRDPKKLLVNLRSCSKDGEEGKAFVQALLRFGLGRGFDVAHPDAEVRITGCPPEGDASKSTGGGNKMTGAGIRTEILSLVSLLRQRLANWWKEHPGAWHGVQV